MFHRLFTITALSLISLTTMAQQYALHIPHSPVSLADEYKAVDLTVPVPEEKITGATEPPMYTIKPKVDIPITAVGVIWSAYAFTKIYSKDPTPEDKILALRTSDINVLDRWAAGKVSDKADAHSNYLFYGSMPLPFALFIDKKIRKDAWKVSFLYLESMAITGLLYTGSMYVTNRYRPEIYNTTELTMDQRRSGNGRNAFFAGHVALVGTTTFFTAKIYNDYHPESNFKYVLWGGAAAATGATIYMRHKAGKHFPTDIVVGTAVGFLSGYLVPHLHKNKRMEKQAWMLSPSFGDGLGNEGMGLSFTYTFQ